MKWVKVLKVEGNKLHRHDMPVVILAIGGPLIGLVYVLFFPLAGLVSSILIICYRTVRGLTTIWHRVTNETANVK